LLIYAVVIDYKNGTVYPDEYLNEIAILRQHLIDQARHRRGKQIGFYKPTKVEIVSV
jgi:hypothetical protein